MEEGFDELSLITLTYKYGFDRDTNGEHIRMG